MRAVRFLKHPYGGLLTLFQRRPAIYDHAQQRVENIAPPDYMSCVDARSTLRKKEIFFLFLLRLRVRGISNSVNFHSSMITVNKLKFCLIFTVSNHIQFTSDKCKLNFYFDVE